jgi:hypothetical protein
MSLITGINATGLTFGNRSDVCDITARELAMKERIDMQSARAKLRGHLEGKKCIKLRKNGTEFVISLEKWHEITKANPLEQEETYIHDEEKKSE